MDSSEQKLQELEEKLDAIWRSVEKTRRYFQITMWVTVIFLVLPLVGIVFVLPMFLNSYLGSMNDASLDSGDQNQLELLNILLQ